jgi:hypothetical protein
MQREIQRIAVLEQMLVQEKKGSGSAIAEANLRHLTEANAQYKRILQDREDELSQLRPIMRELKAKVDEFEAEANAQKWEELEDELSNVKKELAISNDINETSTAIMEELEKKVKGKEWVIKSLQEESHDQCNREHQLIAHVKKLNEKIKAYEIKFEGGGVDVPMLLAKLKDYEDRMQNYRAQTKDREEMGSIELEKILDGDKSTTSQNQPNNGDNDKKDDASEATDDYSFLHSEQDEDDDEEEEEVTFLSQGTDNVSRETYVSQGTDPSDREDALGDFLYDANDGIEVLNIEGMCCAHRRSPTIYYSSQPQRSPERYSSNALCQ